LAKLALGSGGSSGETPSLVRLQIAEEPRQAWWPQGWHPDDRYYAYGAPITRLAVTSNAIHEAVMNPPSRLQALLQKTVGQQGGKVQVSQVSSRAPLPGDAVLLHQEASAPMHNLLSLANTESHNFTAEVLLRQAAGTWDLGQAAQRETLWLGEQGLPPPQHMIRCASTMLMLELMQRTDCIGIGPERLFRDRLVGHGIQCLKVAPLPPAMDFGILRLRGVPLSAAAKPMATLFARYLSS
jgi:hypothetical protein